MSESDVIKLVYPHALVTDEAVYSVSSSVSNKSMQITEKPDCHSKNG